MKLRLLLAVTVSKSAVLLKGLPGHFKNLGYEVHLVSSPGPEVAELQSSESLIHHPVEIPRTIAPLRDLITLIRLIRLLKKTRPEIVNAGTPKAGLLLSIAAFLCNIPIRIYTIRGFRFESETGFTRRLLVFLEAIAVNCSNASICISRSLMTVAKKELPFGQDNLIFLSPGSSNGIDLDFFKESAETRSNGLRFREENKLPKDAFVIGFLGRMNQSKGLEELIEAWQNIREIAPNTFLFLAGGRDQGQPLSKELYEKIEHDNRIIEFGHITNTNDFLSSIDLFTLPTHREGFGNVLIQAAAMGKAIVTTRCTGCVDAAQENYNASFVPPKDPHSLANAILRYINTPDRLHKHAMNGKLWATRFDQTKIWQGLHRLYQNLFSQANGTVL